MKITIELSDELSERLRAAAEQKNHLSTKAFVHEAVANEIERCEGDFGSQGEVNELQALAKQMRNLERGQRAIVALVDSSAAVLSGLLRHPHASGKVRNDQSGAQVLQGCPGKPIATEKDR